MRTLTAVLSREEDVYIAECPEVGTVSQGETVEEAVANLKEATALYLAEAPPFLGEACAPADGCTDFRWKKEGGPSSRRLRWPGVSVHGPGREGDKNTLERVRFRLPND